MKKKTQIEELKSTVLYDIGISTDQFGHDAEEGGEHEGRGGQVTEGGEAERGESQKRERG